MPTCGGTNPFKVPAVLASEELDARNNVSPPEEGSAGLVLSQVKQGRWQMPDHPLVADSEAVTCESCVKSHSPQLGCHCPEGTLRKHSPPLLLL